VNPRRLLGLIPAILANSGMERLLHIHLSMREKPLAFP